VQYNNLAWNEGGESPTPLGETTRPIRFSPRNGLLQRCDWAPPLAPWMIAFPFHFPHQWVSRAGKVVVPIEDNDLGEQGGRDGREHSPDGYR
jgi:hypothetical protein